MQPGGLQLGGTSQGLGGLKLNLGQTSGGLSLGGASTATTSSVLGAQQPKLGGLGTGGLGTGGLGTGGLGTGGLGTGGLGTGGLGTGGLGTGGLGTGGLGTGGLGTGGLGTGGLGTGGLGTGGLGTGGLGTGGLGTGGLGTGGLGTGGLGTGGLGTGGLGTGGLGTGSLGTGGLGTSGLGTGVLGTGGLGTGGLGTSGLGTGGLGTGGLGGLGMGGSNLGAGGGLGTGALKGLGGLSTQKSLGIGGLQPQQTNLTTLQQQQQLNHRMLTMVNAVRSPAIFDDDRDQVVTRFNVLQACSGVGKGLAMVEGCNELQGVDFTPENPFCKFKTLCYNRLPSSRNEDGLVTLQFNKPDSLLHSQQETVTRDLQTIVNAATVQVVVDTIRPLPDNCSELTLYMTEKSFMGTRRLFAADVYVFLNSRKAHLEKLGVTGLYPKTGFSEENLKLYLQNPPSGITAQMWEQSKSDNPDPQKYIPVAILGSKELLKRAKHQQQETKQHQSRLEIISAEVADLQSRRAVTCAKMEEQRRKLVDLGHRALQVMATQEIVRKSGHSVQPQEEQLRIRLESIQAQLDAPLQFKGRLNEIMSQIRMHTQIPGSAGREGCYEVDPPMMSEIQQHLEQQQGALTQLVKVIREDLDDLRCIEESFAYA